jgi:hypothetical protein
MGAGIPQTAPKPPSNSGLVAIAKGLTNTPAAKNTALEFSGTLDNCTGFEGIPTKFGTPITSGDIDVTIVIPPGSVCGGLTPGFPVKSSVSITWNAINPNNNKPQKAYTENTTVASYVESNTNPITIDMSSQAFGPKSKTPGFMDKHADLRFVIDEVPAAIAPQCATPDGVKQLHFTGVNGPSTLVVLP